MSATRKNLLLLVCVSAVVVPGVFLAYVWSARFDGETKPEVVCFQNLRQIDGAKQAWAWENGKTTNDTPTLADLQGYLGSTSRKCPVGGTYRLGKIGESPTCSVPEHNALYQKERP
jgi:hypothetical protein